MIISFWSCIITDCYVIFWPDWSRIWTIYMNDSPFLNVYSDFKQLICMGDETWLPHACGSGQMVGVLISRIQTSYFQFKIISQIVFYKRIWSREVARGYCWWKLTWGPHIDYVSLLLRRLVKYVPLDYIKIVNYAYLESVILYGLVLWRNCWRINDIVLLEKRAVRVLTTLSIRAHCWPIIPN